MIATTRSRRPPRADLPAPEAIDAHPDGSATAPIPARPTRGRGREKYPTDATRDHSAFPEVLDALAGMPTATPTACELARALAGAGPSREGAPLAPILRAMERNGLVESWPDPSRPGEVRVMLSALAVRMRGLALSRRGDRWEPARGGT